MICYIYYMKEENIKKLYPFQYYTFKNLLGIKQYLNKYMFNLEHNNELYMGNINGLLTMGDMLPVKMLKYFISDINHKATFILPENYKSTIDGLTGFREQVLEIIEFFEQKNQITIITYNINNSDILAKTINTIKDIGSMKFDVAIMNPPYSGDLHINILKEVLTHAKTIVNISPNPFINYRKNTGLTPNEIIEYSYEDSCKVFGGIQLQCPLAITIYDESNQYADLTKYTPELYKIFLNKVKFDHSFKDVNVLDYNGVGVFVPLKLMTAVWDKNKNIIVDKLGVLNNSYTLDGVYYKDLRNRNKNRACGGIPFNTINEAKNFYDSCNTTFYKAYVKMFHVASRYVLKDYPFMEDYTSPWTNKRFCEHYNLTGYISDTTAVPGSDWDLILKESV